MKMYLKLIPDSYGQYTKKIIEMQKIYKDTLKQIEQADVLPSAAVPDLDAAESRLHPKPQKNLNHVA